MSAPAPPPAHARAIGKYHALLKQIAGVQRDARFPTAASKAARRRVLEAQLRSGGGLEAYQAASLAGEAAGGGHDCSRWVVGELAARAGAGAELRLLDVGAIVPRFPSAVERAAGGSVALHVRSIDLSPQDPRVERRDFFELPVEPGMFQVVVLSLVLNFVPSASLRGEMLRRAHGMCGPGGMLFVVLPLACVDNSRHCDEGRLRGVLAAVGWAVRAARRSEKLFFLVCGWEKEGGDAPAVKGVVRGGEGRNNFAVALESNAGGISGKKRVRGRERGKGPGVDRKAVEGKAAGGRAVGKKARDGIGKPMTSNQRRKARRHARKGKDNGSG